MIKELVQFTEYALEDPVFKNIGVAPKDGLHIVLSVLKTEAQTKIAERPAFVGFYNSKKPMDTSGWPPCTDWWKSATLLGTVDTNKLFDNPSKAIHTVSPFCFAIKRTNLEGGEKFAENESLNKPQVYDRINAYFVNATKLLTNIEDHIITDAFRLALNDRTRFQRWLDESGYFEQLKGGDYVIFYLDLPIEKYDTANQKYLKDRLFTASEYTLSDPNNLEEFQGTSPWNVAFQTKKPFKTHQTSTFDIAGRVTSKEAQLILEFCDLSRRKLFPNPLPLFIYKDEITKSFKIFKQDVISGEERKKGYLELIGELQQEFKKEVGNYYLLYMLKGEIRDFEFVSRFEYQLKEKEQDHWQIFNLFKIKGRDSKTEIVYPKIRNVGDLQTHVFWKILANKYRKWEGYFNDIEEKNFDKLPCTLLAFRKYRKAIYDLIYKSMKQSMSGQIFKEIMLAGIDDDLKQARAVSLMDKLNIWFSLNHHFDPSNANFKNFYMPNKFQELLSLTQSIADSKEQVYLSDEVEFAFVAGQLIDYLLQQTEAAAPTHTMLEPFALKGTTTLLVQEIEKTFQRYGHKLPRSGRGRFEKLMCALQAYNLEIESLKKQVAMKDIKSFMLAGYFAPSVFFVKKQNADGQNQSPLGSNEN